MAYNILISRFNWPHAVWKNNYDAAYQDWIDVRFELLRRYTAKSARNFVRQPDLWLVLASDYAHNVVERLQTELWGLPYRLVLWSGKSEVDSIRDALSDLSFPSEVRTTRLDTDDLIASDYFLRLDQLQLPGDQVERGVAISCPGGSIYLENQNHFYFSSYPENPFLTYAEHVRSASELKTVHWTQHTTLIDDATHAKFIRSYHPMWASVVHNHNLGNQSLVDVCRFPSGDRAAHFSRFGLPAEFSAAPIPSASGAV
ncbi:MAG: glycosyltransferase [Pseudomonadota bacterium]